MRIETDITAALAACAFVLGASAACAAEFDATMEKILAEYLTIQEALAADSTEGVEAATRAIRASANELHPNQVAGERAERYQNIPQDLLAACDELEGAEDIHSVRESFKELSKPVSTWVRMAKPAGTSVMYCSMAKASWVQRGSKAANPYLGSEMPSCGEKVGGSDG